MSKAHLVVEWVPPVAAGRRETVHPVQQANCPVRGAEEHDSRVQLGRVLPDVEHVKQEHGFIALHQKPVTHDFSEGVNK